jgi:predicted DNA-binding transcriptional regulator AlpA
MARNKKVAAAIVAATADITALPDDRDLTDPQHPATYERMPDDATTVRIRTYRPDRVSADSSYVGTYASRDAWAVAGRLAVELGGEITRTALHAIEVAHGQRGVLLSMRQIAERANLAESTVRTYRSRGDLPAPDVTIGTTPGWLPSTIDPWIAALPGQGSRTDLTTA